MPAQSWAGVCRQTGTGTCWTPGCDSHDNVPVLPAGNELTPRSCWVWGPGLSPAWHSLLPFQPRPSGHVTWEPGNHLGIMETEEVIQENSNREWKGSTGDPGPVKMPLLAVPSLISLQMHVPKWAFASSLLFKQIDRNRKGWIYRTAMWMTTLEATENLSKEFTSYLVFFPIFSLDSFAGQPAHRPCLFCKHAGIEHIGPEGCFWAISAIYIMGSFPSCLALLIRLKFYSKPIQHYQLENSAW